MTHAHIRKREEDIEEEEEEEERTYSNSVSPQPFLFLENKKKGRRRETKGKGKGNGGRKKLETIKLIQRSTIIRLKQKNGCFNKHKQERCSVCVCGNMCDYAVDDMIARSTTDLFLRGD